MKNIGAGYGRTGTTSLKLAFEMLGYPCYHMEEVVKNVQRGHFELWDDAFNGRPVDWDALFAEYEATVDFPGCVFYKELMEAYPDAPVILSVRDSEGWWNSFAKLIKVSNRTRFLAFLPFFRKFHGMMQNVERNIFNGDMEKNNAIRAYEEHNEAVKASVPVERLLVYSVSEGWEPLCAFLGEPVLDTPFPHANSGVGEVKQKMRALLRDQLFRRFRGPKFVKETK